MVTAHINRIGTAVPPNDVHDAFVALAGGMISERRDQLLFKRMVGKSAIDHRFSFFAPTERGFTGGDGRYYGPGEFPGTGVRMGYYEECAPKLALAAVDALDIAAEREAITHIVVASCTGFIAPGLDQVIVKQAGLNPAVERTVVGFMGCYAAVNALRCAHHIVRSEPASRVLVVNLELCTLHLQETANLESLLSMLLFGDGASASLVTADETGIAMHDFRSAAIAESEGAITWAIGDTGFNMHLSGEVPIRLGRALKHEFERNDGDGLLRGTRPSDYDVWAVHAGGRSILDAVETSFGLAADKLDWSRSVLKDFGNMSSATLMFVLQRIMGAVGGRIDRASKGFAVAFGPGLAAESFRFTAV